MAKGLKVGDEVPDFSAIDLHGEAFQLNNEIQKGFIVVVFHRGQ